MDENSNILFQGLLLLFGLAIFYICVKFNLSMWFVYISLIVIFPILFIIVEILQNIARNSSHYNSNMRINIKNMIERQRALKKAKIYLRPYDNIWNNLELYNTNCWINFQAYQNMPIISCVNVKSHNLCENFKLEKFKEQKKGLMQKLLTGQIRVKV